MPRVYKRITNREHKPRTRVKEDDRSAALTLIDAGLTTSQIEEQTGVSRSQIRRYKRNIRMWNTPSAPRTKPSGRPPKDAAAKAQREARAAASVIDDVVLPSQNEVLRPLTRDSQPRIIELANTISANTKTLDGYLRMNNLPQPSFASDGPQHLLPANAAAMQSARTAVLDATIELNDLLTPPPLLLERRSNPSILTLLSRHSLAQKVPLDGAISITDLAQACALGQSDLRRLLKYGMAHHRLFNEPAPGLIAHSATSRLLLESDTAAELSASEEIVRPAELRTLDNLSGTHDPINSTQSVLLHHPSLAAPLSRLLTPSNPSAPGTEDEPDPLSTLLPYTVLPGMHILIVEGTSNPNALSHSYSLADTLQGTLLSVHIPSPPQSSQPDPLLQIPDHLSGRVSLSIYDSGDVAEVQLLAADIYILHHLSHANDSEILNTLTALRAVVRSGVRIYICAPVFPEPQTRSQTAHDSDGQRMGITAEKRLREVDLRAVAVFGTRRRTREEWTGLVARAEGPFGVGSIVDGMGVAGTRTDGNGDASGRSGMGVLEIVVTEEA